MYFIRIWTKICNFIAKTFCFNTGENSLNSLLVIITKQVWMECEYQSWNGPLYLDFNWCMIIFWPSLNRSQKLEKSTPVFRRLLVMVSPTCTMLSSSSSHQVAPFRRLGNKNWRYPRSWLLQFWIVLAPPHGRIWALSQQRGVVSLTKIPNDAYTARVKKFSKLMSFRNDETVD